MSGPTRGASGRHTRASLVAWHQRVSCIACRSLVAAVQKFLSGRPALNEETFPFLTKRLGTTSDAQHTVPRSASQLHELLKESATVPVAPFGHHGLDEQPFAADAWYSLTMLAALELPDIPFHVFLSTFTMTALQDVISQGRARFAQAAAVERVSTPTVSDVCEVLQAFYQDAYAQHLKQDWLVKALKIPDDRRHDIEHIAKLFNTATVDFFWHCQPHGITDTPYSKHTLAT